METFNINFIQASGNKFEWVAKKKLKKLGEEQTIIIIILLLKYWGNYFNFFGLIACLCK